MIHLPSCLMSVFGLKYNLSKLNWFFCVYVLLFDNSRLRLIRASSEASLHSSTDHVGGQSSAVKLQAGDSSTEEASVTLPCSNSNFVICGQWDLSNFAARYHLAVNIELGNTGVSVVRRSNELPRARFDASVRQSVRETASNTLRVAYKQRPWVYHPEVDSPAVTFVVHDGSSMSLVIDPG